MVKKERKITKSKPPEAKKNIREIAVSMGLPKSSAANFSILYVKKWVERNKK